MVGGGEARVGGQDSAQRLALTVPVDQADRPLVPPGRSRKVQIPMYGDIDRPIAHERWQGQCRLAGQAHQIALDLHSSRPRYRSVLPSISRWPGPAAVFRTGSPGSQQVLSRSSPTVESTGTAEPTGFSTHG